MTEIMFQPAGKMNLLGYILRSLIERNTATQEGSHTVKRINGRFLITGSSMKLTMDFRQGSIIMTAGEHGRPDAWVSGSLDTLMKVALDQSLIEPLLSGKLRIGGRAWRLVPVLHLLRTDGTP